MIDGLKEKVWRDALMSKTMKVREMGELLGLKKTESYYLIHKGYFKTYLICGKMRVDKESFEQWYDSQFHYKKIDGNPPGAKYSHTMSVAEMVKRMGVSEDTGYYIVRNGWVKSEIINNRTQVYIDSFEAWYATQDRYERKDGGRNVSKTD